MASYTKPIWKDVFVTLQGSGVTTGIPFRISTGGNVIYQGTCWPRPGTDEAVVKINDICADFLPVLFPRNPNKDYYSKAFDVEAYISGAWVARDTITFYRDWSYDLDPQNAGNPQAPILPWCWRYQWFPLYGAGGSFSYSYVLENGTSNTISFSSTGEFGTLWLPGIEDGSVAQITANGHTFEVRDTCGGYVLYYCNRYGGWDFLPLISRVAQGADVTHYNKDIVYRNDQHYWDRGRVTYVNNIEQRYRISIGPLNSEQSAKMAHLLGSPHVYLHDMNHSDPMTKILPVTLTATSYEIEDQRGRFHFYDVEATLAQEQIRR